GPTRAGGHTQVWPAQGTVGPVGCQGQPRLRRIHPPQFLRSTESRMLRHLPLALVLLLPVLPHAARAAEAPAGPPAEMPLLRAIGSAPSAARIEADIRTLVGFGTRHTLSETASETRGIG